MSQPEGTSGPVGRVTWLLAHNSQNSLAKRICARCEGKNEDFGLEASHDDGAATSQTPSFNRGSSTRDVEWKQIIRWRYFRDKFPNLFIDDVKNMAGKDVIFLASFHEPSMIFEQISVIYQIPRQLTRSFTVILPYFPTGTMERVDLEGQIATAKTLATILSAVPLSARGPMQLLIFDIHNLAERFYFSDNVIPRLVSAIPLLKRELHRTFSESPETVAIAFPDDGAFKRFHSMFAHYEKEDRLITCVKIREKDRRIVTIKDGDPRDCDCVIVDDLVMTGGTLLECAKALLSAGAKSVSAFSTHAIFPEDSWRRFTDSDPPFANFWITDSVPHATHIADNRPFRLLSLSDVIADTLLGFDLVQDV